MDRWFKPTVNTKFHIDFEWWKKQGRDFRLHLYRSLCPDCQALYAGHWREEEIDWIDPETAEVKRIDGLWESLRTCCSQKPDYLAEDLPLISAIFRLFLANGNAPLSPVELYERLGRSTPEVILTVLTGREVYLGIKPVRKAKTKRRR